MAKIKYYVYKHNGEVRRLVKIEDGINAEAYINGSWSSMPNLLRIQNEDTDFEEISEGEAEKLIKEGNLKEVTR